MFKSAYKFSSTEAGALTFGANDKFVVLDNSVDAHWWVVANENGDIGFAPGNYLTTAESDNVVSYLNIIDEAVVKINRDIKSGAALKKHNDYLIKLERRRSEISSKNVNSMPKYSNSINAAESSKSTKRLAPMPPTESPMTVVSHPISYEGDTVNSGVYCRVADQPNDRDCTNIEHRIASVTFTSSHGAERANSSAESKVSCTAPSCHTVSESSGTAGKLPGQATSGGGTRLSADRDLVGALNDANHCADPAALANELVEKVRKNTKLSYDSSKVAVLTVLSVLGEHVNSVLPVVEPILMKLSPKVKDMNAFADDNSEDAMLLRRILSELNAAKEDSQQRSWILHEDEGMISNNIRDLISLLGGANPSICRKIISSDNYSCCDSLVRYYQMETRVSIRLLLLEAFGCMCALDSRILSELMNTVLPLELARDMQHDTSDVQKLKYSATLFSMLFSTGEIVPPDYYVHLNSDFVNFLLDCIENGVSGDDLDQVPDICVKVLLSFNLHFELPQENIVMAALSERGTAKTFTEKLLILFNREIDPVKHFEYKTKIENSVVKFITDLYSTPGTASLLYSNDSRVLIDIVTRRLTDLPPGDKMRTEYLSLMHLNFVNTDYFEHSHRLTDLRSCFHRILQEEELALVSQGLEAEAAAKQDRDIIRLIFRQFPQHFNVKF